MSDFTDVANTLAAIIAPVVYPNGTGQPSIAPGAKPVLIYQGWPIATQLDADLKIGKIHVSVWPTPTERVTESNAAEIQDATISTATFDMVVAGAAITMSGAGGAGQNAALLLDGQPFVYAVQANDTPTTIATALATLVNASRSASSAGPVIIVPGTRKLVARVGVQGTGLRILRRQEKIFQISVWANCFDQRDPIAAAIDSALTGIYRIALPDGTQGILRYRSSMQHDDMQKAGIYRRDMLYAVDYPTTDIVSTTQIVVEQLNVSVPAATQSITVYS